MEYMTSLCFGRGSISQPSWAGLGLCLAFAACAFGQVTVPEPVRQAEARRVAVMAEASRATVLVFSPDGEGGGSGVVISPDGYALTNFHVVAPVGPYMQCGMADGQLYDAVVVSLDPTGDLALIKLFGRDDFPTVPLGDSDQVRVGDWCFAAGNPFLLATNLQPTISYGIISGVHRYQYPSGTFLEYTDCLQTDAAINPGNSGGPLFNEAGELIGINGRCSFEKRGRVNVGVGYAISINQIKNFWGYLHSGRILDHATLGATVYRDADGRVVVSNILESSDAYRRGLRFGDEVISFAGRPIRTVNEFKNVLGIVPPRWRVPMSYRRDGRRYDIFVRLATLHRSEELFKSAWSSPEEKDKPERKKPEKKDSQPPEKPLPPGHPQKTVTVPEHLAEYYEPRTGYANYYFNKLNRTRIWHAATDKSDFAKHSGTWKLQGKFAGEQAVVLTLEDEGVRWELGGVELSLEEQAGLTDQLEPEGSGGLLLAAHLWRRLLVRSPEQFGEVFYLGTAPLPNSEGLFDVLVGVYDVTESLFYFDVATGRLVAMEMFPDTGVDPCEIRFSDMRTVDDCIVPFRWTVFHGDEMVADLQLSDVKLGAKPQPES